MITDAIYKLVNNEDLTLDVTRDAMEQIMEGKATNAQIASFLTAMRMKGESIDEITACAMVMRQKCSRIQPNFDVLDIVGTGGDEANTFNISTISSLVIAAGGIPVAKHGNRSVSSKCGSADVLESLGVKIDITAEQSEKVLNQIGMTFMYAPTYHASMELLGAKVHSVESGTATLKDAVNETMREWTKRIDDTHYVLGSVMGPHPFPTIVRDFQSVISLEARAQILEKEGKLPAAVLACVGGGSNSMGAFYHFINDEGVRLIGCEAAGRGVDTDESAATMALGTVGVFHGMKSYFCQDEQGQIAPVYSISAGLDYPGVGPEHAYLHDIGRAEYVPITDDEAVDAFEYLSKMEGIIPAIESSHAIAYAKKIAGSFSKDDSIIICVSGRGDKDVAAIARYKGVMIHE